MSAYLKFFQLEQSPFDGEGQTQVVLGTRALRDAFASIEAGLAENASRICVSGQRGLGKSSLARALPKLLGDSARVALIGNPTLSWDSARGSIAKQWGLAQGGLARTRLLEAATKKRLVLVVDQAEQASEEFLDHLDVMLSYRSEDDRPVVQSVLLARLTAAPDQAPAPLVWWLDRIQTLQLEFAPLPRDGVESYIARHLKRAGWRGERLFSADAAHAIHGYTGGVPLEVSALCEKLLDAAAARGITQIDASLVHALCDVDPDASDDAPWDFADELEELALENAFVDADSDRGNGDRGSQADVTERMDPPSQEIEASDVFSDAYSDECSEAYSDADSEESGSPPGAGAEITLDEPVPSPDEPSAQMPGDADLWDLEAAIGTAWPSDALAPPAITEAADPATPAEPLAHAEAVAPAGAATPAEAVAPAEPPAAVPDAAFAPEHAEPAPSTEPERFDPLDAPPTPEELRAIRGSGLARMARHFAVAAVAALLGGGLIALFMGGAEPAPTDLSDSLNRTTTGPRTTGALDLAPQADARVASPAASDARAASARSPSPSPIQLDGGYLSADAVEELRRRGLTRAADGSTSTRAAQERRDGRDEIASDRDAAASSRERLPAAAAPDADRSGEPGDAAAGFW